MTFWELFSQALPAFLEGMGITLELWAISILLAVVIGLLSCLMGISKYRVVRAISNGYINIIRGTPLLVQAFFIYFGVTQALGIRMTAFVAGTIALCLNAGAYLSEIFRGGIQAVGPGQMEAARSLGLPYRNAMTRVVLPQALRIATPSMVNQFIITLKDTSILSAIGLAELTQQGRLVVARTFKSFDVWIIIGIMYFVVIYILSKLAKYVERRLSIDYRAKKQSKQQQAQQQSNTPKQ